ncbi:hypothetical protein ACU635_26225 [[Actinomadura] parvosata]|uniref:hypothetical protein n=1 Tax=[Actinomadura] parvosata TaxID=1955412 RepID=UPI00406CEEB9
MSRSLAGVLAAIAGGFLNPILGAITYERVPREVLAGWARWGRRSRGRASRSAACWPGAAVSLAGLALVLLACGTAYALVTSGTGLRPGMEGNGPSPRPFLT